MILTGKAKEDFFLFIKENRRCSEKSFREFPEIFEDALIIEWFDSVGIYIEIGKDQINFLYIVHKGDYKKAHFKCGGFDTRPEATEEAIKKANEIYENNRICNAKSKNNNKN